MQFFFHRQSEEAFTKQPPDRFTRSNSIIKSVIQKKSTATVPHILYLAHERH